MKQYVNFIEKDHSQSFETALEEIVRVMRAVRALCISPELCTIHARPSSHWAG
jgi:hypothetical protein